jgi:O-antigen ligase
MSTCDDKCDDKNDTVGSERSLYARLPDRFKNYDPADLGILFFVLYIFAHRWFVLYFRSGLLQLLFVNVLLLLIFFSSNARKSKIVELSKIDLFWLFGFVVILIYIIMAGFTNYTQDIYIYGAGLAFIIAASIIYALGTIAQYLFTDSFNQIIFKFTTSMTQERIESVTWRGYFPGFGFGKTGLAAGYIAIGLGLVSFNRELKSKKQRIIDAIIFIILLVGLILTGKRSSILWVAAALPFVHICLGAGREKLKRLIKMSALVILILVVVVILFQAFDAGAYFSRIGKIYRALEAGDGISGVREVRGRLILFKAAWEIFLANPIFGIGWNQFIKATSGLLAYDYLVHNIYLQLLSEMGLFGFTAVMVPLIYSYVLTYKYVNLLLMQQDTKNSLWIKGLSFSLYYQTYFLLMGLSEYVLYSLIPALLYFFSLAIINAYLVYADKAYLKVNLNILLLINKIRNREVRMRN